MTITIYHNPKCGTSRNTLALIRNAGVEPEVIEYLINPPSKTKLLELTAAIGKPVRDVMRTKEEIYSSLGLDDAKWSEDELVDIMLAHPILINRPIVVTAKGTRLCRPSEEVLEILSAPQLGEFSKEDGEKVIDAEGKRVN
ncbi:arsenate reductase (glutaredoxin) [Undibacterium sp.]|uniref:arsenate reductase (glutaredoxin) n=1 Tax=Undibacterium sp. TaxID=1914977 RepID=UPI0037519D01